MAAGAPALFFGLATGCAAGASGDAVAGKFAVDGDTGFDGAGLGVAGAGAAETGAAGAGGAGAGAAGCSRAGGAGACVTRGATQLDTASEVAIVAAI
ncbi:MAG: hypothetical protein M3O26_04415 [Pseudomonadota bacterium]|nr:hypothetical protein [Pseudomonadota bacterium]